MKCIINCPARSVEWVREAFPGLSPYLLPVGNKPYLEYLVDFCALSGIRAVRVVSDEPDPEVRETLGAGERWNLEISYGTVSDGLSPQDVVNRNRGFAAGEDVWFFNGMFRIHYDKREMKQPEFFPSEICGHFTSAGDGWCLIGRDSGGGKPVECEKGRGPGVSALDSVSAFFEFSMAVAYREMACFDLPGYGGTPNVLLGRNVIIPRAAEVTEPTLLGDSIQLGHGTRVGPGAIIGSNSLIDDDAAISDSVVMGNSYVGCNLELHRKIVYQNVITDPDSGMRLDIVDEFLLTPLVKDGGLNCPYKQRVAAFFLWLIQLIPFLVFRPWIDIRADEVECYMNQQRSKKIRLHLYVRPASSFPGRWFRRLSLDRFHLLPLIWFGELRLVGSLILEANPENARVLRQFPDYSPGIFSFSELLGHEEDRVQREMDELYYMYHTGFLLNWQILLRTLARNLLKRG